MALGSSRLTVLELLLEPAVIPEVVYFSSGPLFSVFEGAGGFVTTGGCEAVVVFGAPSFSDSG